MAWFATIVVRIDDDVKEELVEHVADDVVAAAAAVGGVLEAWIDGLPERAEDE